MNHSKHLKYETHAAMNKNSYIVGRGGNNIRFIFVIDSSFLSLSPCIHAESSTCSAATSQLQLGLEGIRCSLCVCLSPHMGNHRPLPYHHSQLHQSDWWQWLCLSTGVLDSLCTYYLTGKVYPHKWTHTHTHTRMLYYLIIYTIRY